MDFGLSLQTAWRMIIWDLIISGVADGRKIFSYIEVEPLERKDYYDQLTLSMMYAYSEHYVLTLGRRDVGTLKEFLEKLPGSPKQKLAQVRAAYAYLMLHPGGEDDSTG